MPVSGDTSLPIAPRNKSWQGSDARRRVVDFYTKNGTTNWSQVKKAFFWIDPGKEDQLTGYNLGFADIVDGKLQIIDNGVFAVAGGHGVTRIQAPSASQKNTIKRKVNAIYRRMKAKWPNDRFAFDPPFDDVKSLDEEIDMDIPEEAQEVIDEVEQKFYPMYGTATSFAELESLEAVREAINKVFKTVHQFESLAYSIARQSSTPNDLVTGLKRLTKEMTNIFGNMDFDEELEAKAGDQALTHFINEYEDLETTAVSQKGNGAILKGKGGQQYFYGRFTNNIWDKDNEVLLNKAHQEFADYLDKNPEKAPELWDWHERNTAKKHQAIWWDYSDGFFHMIWPITEDEAKGIEDFMEEFEPGMSHGFKALQRLQEDPRQIEKYRTFEGSILPVEYAANEWTTFEVVAEKEANEKMFSPEKKRALELLSLGKYVDPLGKSSEEDAATIDESGAERATKGTDGTDNNVDANSIPKGNNDMPDNKPNPDTTPDQETTSVTQETTTPESEIKSDQLEALQVSIVEGLDIISSRLEEVVKGFTDRLDVLEEAFQGIKQTKGQSPSVAAWVAAQKAQTSAGDPPTKEDPTGTGEITKEDPLFGKGPEEHPIPTADGHMLNGL